MKMTRETLDAILRRPGYSIAQGQLDPLGRLATPEHKPKSRPALVKDVPRGQGSESGLGVVVGIIAVRNKFCDNDNSRNGYKPLQDAIARSLGIDDGSDRIRFDYGQLVSAGSEGTIVRIEWIQNT